MWLMKVKQNFGKIDILKTRELVSFWGVKTDFGKIAQKWGITKKDFNHYCVVAFDPNKIYTHWAPQNDCLNLSFVKGTYAIAKKWPEMVKNGCFWNFFFSYKIEKHIWWKNLSQLLINYDLDLVSTSKWSSETQFCERYTCSWQKKAKNDCKIADSKHFIFFHA